MTLIHLKLLNCSDLEYCKKKSPKINKNQSSGLGCVIQVKILFWSNRIIVTHCPGLHSVTLKHTSFLESQNVTIFRSKVVADVISLDEVILEEGGPLIQSDWCPLMKRKKDTRIDTEGR